MGSTFSSSNCKDSAKPVPCGDGSCRSNYVACLRAISDAERRDSLRSSILWAFKRYSSSSQGGGAPPGDASILAASGDGREAPEELDSGNGGGSSSSSSSSSDGVAWKESGDAYMRAVFGVAGKEDRAGGTRLLPSPGPEAGGGGRGGRGRGGRLAVSSEVHRWSGGSLEYTSEGLVGKEDKGPAKG